MEYFDLLRKIYFDGKTIAPRGKTIKELLNQQIIINKYNYFESIPARTYAQTSKYFWKELAWYFSGDTKNKWIVPHAKMWKNIENPDGTANSNYGHLVFYKKRGNMGSGFNWALHCLINDINSRQAVITYNDGSYNLKNNKDYICSQQQHFMIRENKLICTIYLRSSDAIFGLQYNYPWWSIVQQYLYLGLLDYYPDLKIGAITVNIGSAHIYQPHFGLVEEMLAGDKKFYYIMLKKPLPLANEFNWYDKHINKYFTKMEVK